MGDWLLRVDLGGPSGFLLGNGQQPEPVLLHFSYFIIYFSAKYSVFIRMFSTRTLFYMETPK